MTNKQNIVTPWVCKLSHTSTTYKSCCIPIPAGPTEEEVSPGLMRPDPQHRNTPNVPRCAPEHRLHWDAGPKVKEVVANIAPEQTPPSTIPRHCWRLGVREAFVRSVCQPHHREPLANGLHCFWKSFKSLFLLGKTANGPVPDEQEHATCTLISKRYYERWFKKYRSTKSTVITTEERVRSHFQTFGKNSTMSVKTRKVRVAISASCFQNKSM